MSDSTLSNALTRLEQANRTIAKLDPAIKAVAFELIQPLIFTPGEIVAADTPRRSHKSTPDSEAATDDTEFEQIRAFIAKQEDEKPSDNVYSIVGWLYSQYGTQPFEITEIKKLADDAGVTVPARIDMTLTGMKKSGKSLVQNLSKGRYRVTVQGEIYFKEKYGISKGIRKRTELPE